MVLRDRNGLRPRSCVIAAGAAWRWGVQGGFLGFVAFSGLIVLPTEAQYWFDPKRDAGVLDAAVVSMGIALDGNETSRTHRGPLIVRAFA